MGKARLYDVPEVTREVLRLVIKGHNTREELAEELGCSPRTVYNKVHDPKVLGFLEREDNRYVISDKKELMKLFQLDKREVLKKRFENLPGVEEINDELVGGSLTFVRVGRIVSYYTNSEAIDEEAFVTYGRVYAKWFDYLGMGYAYSQKLSREKPANYEKEKTVRRTGDGFPMIRPERVFKAIRYISDGEKSESELASELGYSESQIGKLLSTLYSLNLADRNDGIVLTEFGEQVYESSESEQKKLIREALLDLNVVKKYCELAPESPFKNQQLMERVGEELGRDWTNTTRETKGKRIYQWLLFSDLFKEVKRGTLVPTAVANRDKLSSIEDYA